LFILTIVLLHLLKGFFFSPHADYSSCWGDHKVLGKERLWGDDIRWCRPICVQLCLLPFPSVCRAKWDKVSLCACTSFLDHRRGDSDAICCFLVGGTCFFVLVRSVSIHLALYHHKHLSLSCYRQELLRWVPVLKYSNKQMSVWWMKKVYLWLHKDLSCTFFDLFQKVLATDWNVLESQFTVWINKIPICYYLCSNVHVTCLLPPLTCALLLKSESNHSISRSAILDMSSIGI